MTARELSVRQLYAERLERECTEAHARSERQQANVEQARSRLAFATREREQVDHLEQRKRGAHDTETRRLEATESNEIALLSHLRSEGDLKAKRLPKLRKSGHRPEFEPRESDNSPVASQAAE